MNVDDLIALLRSCAGRDAVHVIIQWTDGVDTRVDVLGVQRVFDIVPPGQNSLGFVAIVAAAPPSRKRQ